MINYKYIVLILMMICVLNGVVGAKELTVSNGVSISNTVNNYTIVEKQIYTDLNEAPEEINTKPLVEQSKGIIESISEVVFNNAPEYSDTPITSVISDPATTPTDDAVYKAQYINKYSNIMGSNTVIIDNDTIVIDILNRWYDIKTSTLAFNITAKANGVEKLIHNPYKIYNPPVLVISGNNGEVVENIDDATLESIASTVISFDDGTPTFDGIDPTMTIYPTYDAYMANETAQSTGNMVISPGGSVGTATPGNVMVTRSASAGTVNNLTRYGLNFNTSPIGAAFTNTTVTNASIQLRGTARSNSAGAQTIVITGYTPASNTSIAAADFNKNKSVILSSTVTYANWVTNDYNIMYFNAAGISYIDKEKYTNVMARLLNDVNSALPSGTSVATSTFAFRTTAYSGTTQDPKLVIVYESGIAVPISSFTTSTNTTYTSNSMNFNDTSSGLPTSWNWSFGDGSFATTQNTSHIYSSSGKYGISLNVTNTKGTNITSATKWNITVGPFTTAIGSETLITFNHTGSTNYTIPAGVSSISYLVVGGGGSGGKSDYAGGGGAGGYLSNLSYPVYTGYTFNIIVGAGGLGVSADDTNGNSGGLSQLNSSIQALGGGYGSSDTVGNGGNGGSGGGGGGAPLGSARDGGSGTVGQGTDGAAGSNNIILARGGGGGGSNTSGSGVNGGTANISKITGIDTLYAAGGDGSGSSTGDGSSQSYVGSGGGASSSEGNGTSTSGISGIVLIRYTVSTAPVASFTANTTSGVPPLPVLFTDTSTNSPTSWSWGAKNLTPGNNTWFQFSTVQNPVLTLGSGNWSINLTATNIYGSSTSSQTTWVNVSYLTTVPTATFTTSATSGVPPYLIVFNSTTDNVVGGLPNIYSNWSFGDGSWSNITGSGRQNTTHTYTMYGTFNSRLYVTNYYGTSTSGATVITSNSPTISFVADAPIQLSTTPIIFTPTSNAISGTWFNWTFGDGTVSNQTSATPVSKLYATTGIYSPSVSLEYAGSVVNTSTRVEYIGINSMKYYPTSDGYVSRTSSGDFATIRDGTGTVSDNTTEYAFTRVTSSSTDSVYSRLDRIIEIYNIQGIPPTYTITNASINLYGNTHANTFGSSPNLVVMNVKSLASLDSITASDYNKIGTTPLSSNISYAAYTDAGYNRLYLNTVAINTINGSTTKIPFMLTTSWDADNTPPTWSGSKSAYFEPYTVARTGTTQDPYIFVNFTGPPVLWVSNTTVGIIGASTISFNDTTSSTGATWNWSFGDGTYASTQNATHTYITTGLFNVNFSTPAGSYYLYKHEYINISEPTFYCSPVASPIPLSITCYDTSSVLTGSNIWIWGDGSSVSGGSTQSHIYTTAGDYDVQMQTPISGGDVAERNDYIHAGLGVPVVSFAANETTVVGGGYVQFTDTSSPPASAWKWDFSGGDASDSTLQNPIYNFDTVGLQSIKLTVTNAAGSNSTVYYNYINVISPTPSISSNVTTLVAGQYVEFTGHTTGDEASATYHWDFEGGTDNDSISQTPTYQYNNPGIYSINLTVTIGESSGSTISSNLITVSNPTPSFTTNVTTLVAGQYVQFTGSSTGIPTAWKWDFDGGTDSDSTSQNPVKQFSTVGTYSVNLTSNSGNAYGSVIQSNLITVTAPVPSFTQNSTDIYAGQYVQFTGSSTGIPTAWKWDFDGGTDSDSTLQNPTKQFSTVGTYSVNLTSKSGNAYGSVIQSNLITVNPPIPSISANETSIVAGQYVQFTGSSDGSPTAWKWSFSGGTGSDSTSQNPVKQFLIPGTYSINLTVTSGTSSVSTLKTNYITVAPLSPSFTSNVTSVAAGGYVEFYGSTNSPMTTTYKWSFSGGTGSDSTSQNPVRQFSTAGNYSINFTVSSGASASSLQTNYIRVYPAGWYQGMTPITAVDFTVSPYAYGNVHYAAAYNGIVTGGTGGDGSGITYRWDLIDGGSSGDNTTSISPVYTYNTEGIYSVNFTAKNAISSASKVVTNYMTIYGPGIPYANYIAAPSSGTPGMLVTFTDLSLHGTEDALTYNWSFGDGIYSAAPFSEIKGTVIHVYTYSGVYDTNLTITNANGTSYMYKSQYITISQSQSNTWYSPHQVLFKVVDSNGQPLKNTFVNATVEESSLPGGLAGASTSLVNNFGIPPTTADTMVDQAIHMQGHTGSDGQIAMTMHGSLQYTMVITTDTGSSTLSVYPLDAYYILKTSESSLTTPTQVNNTYAGIANSTLTFFEPNASYMTMGVDYYDISGLTDNIQFYIKLMNNNTIIYSHNQSVSGATHVLINSTYKNNRGQQWLWWYDAHRTV